MCPQGKQAWDNTLSWQMTHTTICSSFSARRFFNSLFCFTCCMIFPSCRNYIGDKQFPYLGAIKYVIDRVVRGEQRECGSGVVEVEDEWIYGVRAKYWWQNCITRKEEIDLPASFLSPYFVLLVALFLHLSERSYEEGPQFVPLSPTGVPWHDSRQEIVFLKNKKYSELYSELLIREKVFFDFKKKI